MKYPPQPFDALELGASFEHGPREVSRADIAEFARLSGDMTALHTDEQYAAGTPLKGLVAHGALSLAVATGLAYEMGIFEEVVLAFRGLSASYQNPVRPGDQLSLALTVAALDERPRPGRGRVELAADLRNQEGRQVLSGTWKLLIRRQLLDSASEPQQRL